MHVSGRCTVARAYGQANRIINSIFVEIKLWCIHVHVGDPVEREIEQDSEQTSLKVDISSLSWPNQSPPGTGQGGAAADGTGVGQDDVDGLVQWTRELDEQQLMDT